MEKATFCETIKELLSDLGEVVVRNVNKPQGDYTGLTVKLKSGLSPIVNLDRLYEFYCEQECGVEGCADIARDILRTATEKMPEINADDFLDWEKIKDKLFLRLVRDPSNNIARKVADLFLIACIQVEEDDGTSLAGVVPDLLAVWGVDEDTVFEQAKSVQEHIRPLKFGCLPDILGIDVEENERDMYLVSVEQGISGASAIFYDGVFDKLRETLGDFYLIPSSINEFLAIAKAKIPDVKELACFVKFTNASNVDPRDRLSDSVYEYDFDKKEFKKVEC